MKRKKKKRGKTWKGGVGSGLRTIQSSAPARRRAGVHSLVLLLTGNRPNALYRMPGGGYPKVRPRDAPINITESLVCLWACGALTTSMDGGKTSLGNYLTL